MAYTQAHTLPLPSDHAPQTTLWLLRLFIGLRGCLLDFHYKRYVTLDCYHALHLIYIIGLCVDVAYHTKNATH